MPTYSSDSASGFWSLKELAKAVSSDGFPITYDPYFNSTVLLLNGDDASDAGQNNTFLDSSSNAHTITRNGNVTQGSFSPFSVDDRKWGNYFDGNGDYLNIPHDSSFTLDGAFTIEMWVNFTSNSQAYWDSIVSVGIDATAGGGGATIYHTTSGSGGTDGGVAFQCGGTNDRVLSGSIRNTGWRHVAATRDSSDVCRLFIDGVSQGSPITSADSINATEFGARVGLGTTSQNNYYDGYVSNLRIVKGTALYTSNFTPPTAPLTDVSGTSLLTCQSNRFVDNSSNAHSITVNGDTKVVPFSPFAPSAAYTPATNGGSAYFDRSGDYLQFPSSTDFQFGTGDFTVECWAQYDGTSNTGLWQTTTTGDLQSTSANVLAIVWYQNKIYSYINGSGSNTGSPTISPNTWYHIAMCRSSGTTKVFLNGVEIRSVADTRDYTASYIVIGGYTSTSYLMGGYVSNFRIVKGTAVYTSDFTPPTAPVTEVSGTSLLCNFTNASIVDATGRNVIETVGNAQVDTTTVKYGTGAMEFDGSGDKLTTSNSNIGDFGTGDFTIEAWINADSLSGYNSIIADDTYSSGSTPNAWCFYLDGTSLDGWKGGSSILTGGTLSVGQWHHVAWTRSSGTMYLFLDGVQVATASDSTSFNHGDIIVASNVGNYYFDGHIDDLRITKGIARYTADFTPPIKHWNR